MYKQLEEKILVVAAVAALVGMDGFFSVIEREVRSADFVTAVHAQADPADYVDKVVMHVTPISPESLCTQNDLSIGDEPEILNNEEAAPRTDGEFERIQWNADSETVPRYECNFEIEQASPAQQASW